MKTILVSNRVAKPTANEAAAGGLAAALLTATKRAGAVWLGASGKFAPADGAHMPIHTRKLGAGMLATVDFPAADYRHFYNGMANSVLWPILHYRADLLRYDPEFLSSYNAINDLMATAVSQLVEPDSVVWVHDYHFFTLGKFLRQRGFGGPIGFFLHTPFPDKSVLACLPEHRPIMKALSAYDLIGFQTDDDLLHFRDYATAHLSATMLGQTELQIGTHRVKLGIFPVGIDVDFFADAAQRNVKAARIARIKNDLHSGAQMIGVDRLDYSKGLPERFAAFERFLTTYPDERKRVSFLQITPPTRAGVDSYARVRAELASYAGDINARFASADWTVLRYINEGFPSDELAALYRISKVGLVTPLRDGMNLVAKEYVASQDPADPGVLVLSKFAGAAKELNAALLVNPYDTSEVAHAIHDAFYMERAERIERWSAMMGPLRGASTQGWYDSFVTALHATAKAAVPLFARDVA